MAITFPMSLVEFFEDLAIVDITFTLTSAYEVSETTGGEVIRANYGPRMWKGSVTLDTLPHAEAADMHARVEELFDARASFLITPPHMETATPNAVLNAQQGVREIKLSGLPANHPILRGQFLSFSYGTPQRHALHRVLTARTADATGLTTSWVEVSPAVRPGATNGTAVVLGKPVCKAVAEPDSYSPPSHRGTMSSGASFGWRQTLL